SARHSSRVRYVWLIMLTPYQLESVVAYGFKLWLNRCGWRYAYQNSSGLEFLAKVHQSSLPEKYLSTA
ncbi:hypothetical protein, partial [Aliidiomarina sanyensis]|uniref:hypothetical protein n=1 Tax=Aliidiomarina sanyensis TaxID=1249555 RepID=UPI001A7E0925